MQEFVITKGQLEAIISYLVRQPYNEVAELISSLTKVRPLSNPNEGASQQR